MIGIPPSFPLNCAVSNRNVALYLHGWLVGDVHIVLFTLIEVYSAIPVPECRNSGGKTQIDGKILLLNMQALIFQRTPETVFPQFDLELIGLYLDIAPEIALCAVMRCAIGR